MINRKELKSAAKKSLKKHYLLFVFICLLSSYIGSEFRGSLILTDGIGVNVDKTLTSAIGTITENTNIGEKVNDSINTIIQDSEALNSIQSSDISKKITEKIEPYRENYENIKNQTILDNAEIKGNKGVFSTILNSVSSNNFFIRISQGIMTVIGSKSIAYMIGIIITLIVWGLFTIFIMQMFQIISRRMFLEGRIYRKVPLERFGFLVKAKCTIRASFTLFIVRFKEFLWLFTIVMYPIKLYEYSMVPFILAENPRIKSKDAIKLSKEMMMGNKWKTFLLDLSFIGWEILGVLTLGLSGIFFTNPYIMCSHAELYYTLRKKVIDDKCINYKLLNDRFLFEYAKEDKINEKYSDINEFAEKIEFPYSDLSKLKRILIDIFGINILSKEETKKYEKFMVERYKIDTYVDEMQHKSYPTRLSNMFEISSKINTRVESINYLKPYNISSLIIIFFIMCFIGWAWEVTLNLITVGEFVNKGMLHGPWLPIYGSGGLLILTVLNKFRNNPKLEFLATIILCGTVEYFTGLIIELTHERKKMVGLYRLFLKFTWKNLLGRTSRIWYWWNCNCIHCCTSS